MNCANCGVELGPSDSFCDNCGTAVMARSSGIILERSPAQDVLTAPSPVLEASELPPPVGAPVAVAPPAGAPSVAAPTWGATASAAPLAGQPRFRLAYDERILKTYEAVQLRPGFFKRKRGQGTLYVTDARVVFYSWVYPRGTQRESWLLQQTKLEDISGLEAHVSRRISLGMLILTIAFGLATIANLLIFDIIGAFFLAILTALCLFLLIRGASRRGSVGVTITSRENANSPIGFGHGARTGIVDIVVRVIMSPILFFFPSYSAFDVMLGDPAEDANRLVHELGALILDLQTRGRMAYAHWGIAEVPSDGHVSGAL